MSVLTAWDSAYAGDPAAQSSDDETPVITGLDDLAGDITMSPGLLTLLDPRVGWRYITLATLTVAGTTYYWSVSPYCLDGIWYEPRIAQFIIQGRQAPDDYGFVAFNEAEIHVLDDSLWLGSEDDFLTASVRLETIICQVMESGREPLWQRQTIRLQIVSWTRQAGRLILQAHDASVYRLEKKWPLYKTTVEDFPNLPKDSVGITIPHGMGLVRKASAFLVDSHDGAGPWKFGLCSQMNFRQIVYLYANGVLLEPGDYALTGIPAAQSGYTLMGLEFDRPPVTGSGYSNIQADLAFITDNVIDQIWRVLVDIGEKPDFFTFTQARNNAGQLGMLADYLFTAESTALSILNMLLFIARAILFKDANGYWQIRQDLGGQPDPAIIDAKADALQLEECQRPERRKEISVQYGQKANAPNQLLYDIKETVPHAVGGANNLVLDYVRQHRPADRILYFQAQREYYNAIYAFNFLGPLYDVFDRVRIQNAGPVLSGAHDVIIRGYQDIPGGRHYRATPYHADLYLYPWGRPLPNEGKDDFPPDLTGTPPGPPTDLRVAQKWNEYDERGRAQAHVILTCEPPGENWTRIMFAMRDENTLVVQFSEGRSLDNPGPYEDHPYWPTQGGDPIGSTTLYLAFFEGLAINQEHTAFAWAINENDIEGEALALVLTTPADSNIPARVTLTALSRPTADLAFIQWAPNSEAYLESYQVYRSTDGTNYSYTGTTPKETTQFVDVGLTSGTTYWYQVRAISTSGNAGQFSAASALATP